MAGSDDDDDLDGVELPMRTPPTEPQTPVADAGEDHRNGYVPVDLYYELRPVLPDLRQFAATNLGPAVIPAQAGPPPVVAPPPPTTLAMRTTVVNILSGELHTTGAFAAAAQQAELRAAQFNPELQTAVIDDYMGDNNAMSLMAQLVAYHISRSSTLTPRRDTKMVQLPAINHAIQNTLAQMMYLTWGWDDRSQRRTLKFNYSKWHTVRQERQQSVIQAVGQSGCGALFDTRGSAPDYGTTGGGFASFYDAYRTYV